MSDKSLVPFKNGGATSRVVSVGVLVFAASVVAGAIVTYGQSSTVLFQETFDNSSFASRGWYDSTGGTLSTTEKYAGTSSLECHFASGGAICSGGTPARHLFTPTESVYLSYYIKHSTNWVGSRLNYDPHMFLVMTNEDAAYVGPAATHLTAYVENWYSAAAAGLVPKFIIQDALNIDEAKIGVNLIGVTENRATAGCNGNGTGDGAVAVDCYLAAPGQHANGKYWFDGVARFTDATGPNYKGNWHLIEVYFKLNTIVGGIGQQNGIVQYWFDGAKIIDHSNVIFRTGAHPTMQFNQLAYLPFMEGSPVDQAFWIDNLMIATARPSPPPAPPGATAPRAPSGVVVK
jgi:hypothetical protein